MATDRSTDNYSAILIPWELTSADLDASSSYTEDGPIPGTAEQPTGARLQVLTSGEQGVTTYVVTTRQAGNVGPNGAAFTWRESTDGTDEDRGWDAYNTLAGHRFLTFSNLITTRTPHAATLPDGTVVVVAHYVSATYRVRSYSIDPATGLATEANVYTTTTAPSAQLSSSFHPTVCVLPDGSVICAHLVEDTAAEEAQVRVHRSTDKGVTWTEVSPFALPAAIDVDNGSSTDGFLVRRMRLACNGDQLLLLLWINPSDTSTGTYKDGYIQYGSTSLGMQFDLVEVYTENGASGATVATGNVISPDICVQGGQFHVIYAISSDNLFHQRIGSAYQTLSGATSHEVQAGSAYVIVTFDGSSVSDEVDLICFADPDGSIYATFRDTSGDEWIITRSDDLGDTWTRLGDGLPSATRAWWPDAAVTYPTDCCATVAAGRALVYGNHDATTATYEDSLSEWALGGWSSVTMPGNTAFGRITGRAAWLNAYIPADTPANSGWTATTGGTSTASVSSGYLAETTTTGQRYNTIALSGTPAEGVLFEFVAQQISGSTLTALTSGARAHLDNGITTGYGVQVRFDFTLPRIALYDDVAGTIIGTAASVSWSNTYEVRVEMRGSSVQAWYRVWDAWGDRLWIDLAQTASLTNSGGGGTSEIEFGTSFTAGSTTETRWRRFVYTSDEYTGSRSLPLTNPDDLFARPYVGVGAQIGLAGSFAISASGGPGRGGESYTIAPRYAYPIDLIHWTVSPSLRERWRTSDPSPSTTAPQTDLVFRRSTISSENTAAPPILGVFLGGIRGTPSGTLSIITAAGSATNFNFTLSRSFSFVRQGDIVVCSPSGSTGQFLHRNEAAGWWIKLGTGYWCEVESNTEGTIAGAGMLARLKIKSPTGSEPTSGTATLVPDQAVILLHLSATDFKMVRVRLGNVDTPDDRHYLGACWVGDVLVPGRPWENGERITTNTGGRVAFSAARVPHAATASPAWREGEIGFTTVHHAGAVEGAAVSPDTVTSLTGGGVPEVGIPDAIATTIEGMHRYVNGARPVVLIQRFDRATPTGGAALQVITGRHLIIPCYLTGTYSWRRVVGDNGDDSLVLRGEAFAWTEVI